MANPSSSCQASSSSIAVRQAAASAPAAAASSSVLGKRHATSHNPEPSKRPYDHSRFLSSRFIMVQPSSSAAAAAAPVSNSATVELPLINILIVKPMASYADYLKTEPLTGLLAMEWRSRLRRPFRSGCLLHCN